jgi:hypothetical protein
MVNILGSDLQGKPGFSKNPVSDVQKISDNHLNGQKLLIRNLNSISRKAIQVKGFVTIQGF